MDVIVVLLIIGSLVSKLMNQAQRRQQAQQAEQPDAKRPGPPARPTARPAEADPSRRGEAPIHWGGTVDLGADDAEGTGGDEGQADWRAAPALSGNRAAQPTVSLSNTAAQPTIAHSNTAAQPTITHRHTAAQPTIKLSREPEAQPVAIPGLDLVFDGDTLVNGVIFAEILGRRSPGRRYG